MQSTARDGLTAAQVTALIRETPTPVVSAGLERVDLGLNVLADLTDDFAGGVVSRANYATLHGTADLYVTTELDWGTALLRPYMRLTGYTPTYGTLTARFNLGVYLTSSPSTGGAESPATHQVECYDILHWLNTAVGESFTIEAGTGYLAAIETILIAQGIQSYQIDQSQAGKVLPAPLSWVMVDKPRWLNVINDLAAAVGYQGVWSDWDGRLRIAPYLLPTERAVEWVYDDDPELSLIDPDRVVIRDWFHAPNRWVYYRSRDPEEPAPVEGNGLYVYINELDGPTSVQARGRTISADPEQIDAVDHDALVAAATQRIDADLRLKTTYELKTAPNPLHWHFDKMTITDPGLGPMADVLAVKWSLPLNGDLMTHEWSMI